MGAGPSGAVAAAALVMSISNALFRSVLPAGGRRRAVRAGALVSLDALPFGATMGLVAGAR